MKKRFWIELAIAAVILLAQAIVFAATYGEALRSDSLDVYITTELTAFLYVNSVYAVALLIVNGNRKKEGEE